MNESEIYFLSISMAYQEKVKNEIAHGITNAIADTICFPEEWTKTMLKAIVLKSQFEFSNDLFTIRPK